jgi:hypothetical protein
MIKTAITYGILASALVFHATLQRTASFSVASPVPHALAINPLREDFMLSFMREIGNHGLVARKIGPVSQPLFPIGGTLINTGTDVIHIYEFPTRTGALDFEGLISSDGRKIGGKNLRWSNHAHFFRKDSLIILYIGIDRDLVRVLEDVAGPQFAGNG